MYSNMSVRASGSSGRGQRQSKNYCILIIAYYCILLHIIAILLHIIAYYCILLHIEILWANPFVDTNNGFTMGVGDQNLCKTKPLWWIIGTRLQWVSQGYIPIYPYISIYIHIYQYIIHYIILYHITVIHITALDCKQNTRPLALSHAKHSTLQVLWNWKH